MMITLKENADNTTIPRITHPMSRLHSTIVYDLPPFNYQINPYETGTFHSNGSLSSTETLNKSISSYLTLNNTLNLNNSNFYRRHTESELATSSNSLYPTSIRNNSPMNLFNYPPVHPSLSTATPHYPTPDLLFSWNNSSTLMRTQSASYGNYSQTTPFSRFNPVHSSSTLSTTNKKINENILSNSRPPPPPPPPPPTNYSTFYNPISSTNLTLSASSSIPKPSVSSTIEPKRKRSRLTNQLRQEILKLKSNKPTVFAWEIQQTLLQNGTCTAQNLPSTSVIQRFLNESSKSNGNIKTEPILNLSTPVDTFLNNIENKDSSSIAICLSPTPSPALSNSETVSECSICLETYRSGQEVSILSCSHEYHSSCIKEWMKKNRSCPMCRKDIHNQPQFVTLLI